MAVPMARLRSLFFIFIQDFNSVGGDPSRNKINFLQIQSAFNTIWTERWFTTVQGTWDVDWNNHRKTTLNLVWQVGHNFGNHWNVFAGPGVGVVGRDAFLGLDWPVQAGCGGYSRRLSFPNVYSKVSQKTDANLAGKRVETILSLYLRSQTVHWS